MTLPDVAIVTLSNPLQSGPGAYLREQRILQGIDERQVADELRLSLSQVRYIEEGKYERFAGDVYIKGYLRAYSRLLRVDPDPVIRSYESTVAKSSSSEPVNTFRSTRTSWSGLLFGVIILVLGVLAWWLAQAG